VYSQFLRINATYSRAKYKRDRLENGGRAIQYVSKIKKKIKFSTWGSAPQTGSGNRKSFD